MKKITLIIIAIIGFTQINAQNLFIAEFHGKYKDLENVSSFNIGGNFLENIAINDDESGAFTSKLEQLHVVSLPFATVSANDLNSLKKSISRDDYEELISYREGKERINVFLKEDRDIIKELLVMIENPDDKITLVSLTGNITYDDLNRIEIDGEAGEVIKGIPGRN